ncbi:MAG: 5-formyltetrahydrofolate cyclo-ligase [Deltaproteobacteria bacterium]|nr:5-formyltetrahydrofolate cyclo-ligase [Deltaproteobacteria bacterium]
MRDEKQRLRSQSLLERESLARDELSQRSRLIQLKVLEFPAYLGARTVVLYSPIGNEVATEAIRDHALGLNKKLFYPRMGTEKRPDLIQINATEELQPGALGILEPTGDRVLTAADMVRLVVFVPGIAFDLEGNRLGRGWGWYDRVLSLLQDKATLVALAYEFQVLKTLPAERWDQRVHCIITEKRIIECGKTTSPSARVPKFSRS